MFALRLCGSSRSVGCTVWYWLRQCPAICVRTTSRPVKPAEDRTEVITPEHQAYQGHEKGRDSNVGSVQPGGFLFLLFLPLLVLKVHGQSRTNPTQGSDDEKDEAHDPNDRHRLVSC